MKLKIKLKNHKYCIGCPMIDSREVSSCKHYAYRCADLNIPLGPILVKNNGLFVRPKECIEKNGE